MYTTTVEAYIPATGRAIQGATSHSLGQNFSKIFGIEFSDLDDSRQLAWQNSWGLTTRTVRAARLLCGHAVGLAQPFSQSWFVLLSQLGVCVMVHGDDMGLVLPPRIAPLQVVIIWIYKASDSAEVREGVIATSRKIRDDLKAAGVSVRLDDRTNYASGYVGQLSSAAAGV